MEQLNAVNNLEGMIWKQRLEILDLLGNKYAKIPRFRQLYTGPNEDISWGIWERSLVKDQKKYSRTACGCHHDDTHRVVAKATSSSF